MTKRKSVKQTLTELILKEIPKTNPNYYNADVDSLLSQWWFTGRQDSLRLTEQGMMAFNDANIEFYDFDFKQEGQSYHNFILDLNKKIKCPFYIGQKKLDKSKTLYIRVYDSKIAMMLGLYGNLQEYLNSIRITKNDRA